MAALALNFSRPAPAANILPSGTPLVFADGALALTGSAGASDSQTLGSPELQRRFDHQSYAQRRRKPHALTGTGAARRLGREHHPERRDVGRQPGPHADGLVVASGTTAFATVNGSDWATVSGGNLAAYSGYSANVYTGAGANTNITHRESDPGRREQRHVGLPHGPSQHLDVAQRDREQPGGRRPAGRQPGRHQRHHDFRRHAHLGHGELLIHQYDTVRTLTVNSVLANSGTNATSLTKAGPGMLVLTAPTSIPA